MSYNNILSNLYFNTTFSYPFKDVHCMNMTYIRSPMSRTSYKILDLELWFESEFKEGEELVIRRVSENGKYEFGKG